MLRSNKEAHVLGQDPSLIIYMKHDLRSISVYLLFIYNLWLNYFP